MLAIVQEQDLDLAKHTLEGLNTSFVYLSSLGGFLGMHNATLLIELHAGEEGKTLESLEKSCQKRIEYIVMPLEGSPVPMPMPVPVTVGGATVFTLPVEKFIEM